MNAFVKKEIRLLLPNLLIGIGLAFFNLLLPQIKNDYNQLLYLFPFVFCPAVAAMLALNSFGAEISSGTFTNLLAQPVSRAKIWQIKIGLLAVALAILGIVWFTLLWLRLSPFGLGNFYNLFAAATIVALVIFSGGLWTVLLLRQVAAAFWFTLLVPGFLFVILSGLLAGFSGEFQEGMIVSVLGIYSLAGFFFARWLFFRAQDLQWSGGAIVMPEMRGLARFKFFSGARRNWRPRAALWRKEFQLHQSQFVMAFVLLILHLGVLEARAMGNFQKNSDTLFILENFWILWMVMPLLAGCAAIAEERKLGTLGGQLCLPSKWRTQFAIKFFVALGLSIFLGAIMPLLLEGKRILPDAPHPPFGDANSNWISHFSTQFYFWFALQTFYAMFPMVIFLGIAALIGVISFYASSLTRNTLQSLAPAVLGAVIFFFLMVTLQSLNQFDLNFLWRGQLHFFIALPLMLWAVIWLAAKNFRQLAVTGNLWMQNALKIFLALAISILATSAIYHRVWEKLTPFEPSHGAAKLSLSNPARLEVWWAKAAVRLPDGKIWEATYDGNPSPLDLLLGNLKLDLRGGHFLAESNWTTLKHYGLEIVGVKTDGTLWIAERPKKITNNNWTKKLTQFGDETNWSDALPIYRMILLVKKDGTFWRLGPENDSYENRTNSWPGFRTFTPAQIGTDTNWAKATWDYSGMRLEKTDGSIWIPDNMQTNHTNLKVAKDIYFMRAYDGSGGKFHGLTEISHGVRCKIGIRDDGTFRIWTEERVVVNTNLHQGNYEWHSTDLQIGNETDWLAVAGLGGKVVTLKRDGTLWLWNFYMPSRNYSSGRHVKDFEQKIKSTVPVQLGSHNDWISISGDYAGVTALAADGSLWFWPMESSADAAENYYGEQTLKPLLDFSRKPRWMGNVFQSASN